MPPIEKNNGTNILPEVFGKKAFLKKFWMQSSGGAYKKGVLKTFYKIHRKTPVVESLFR